MKDHQNFRPNRRENPPPLEGGDDFQAREESDDPAPMMASALQAAEVLKAALESERRLLRNPSTDAFLKVLSQKEFLAIALKEKLACALGTGDSDIAEASDTRRRLKETLIEIQTLNESNRIFIEGYLEYFQDFAQVFTRPSYPSRTGERTAKPPYKGLSISREA